MVYRFTDHTGMIRIIQRYEDNKTYPILVKLGGGYSIVEMLGKTANKWNDNLHDATEYSIFKLKGVINE